MQRIYHNIGILAHVDAGKTTLTEQILYLTGEVRSAGSVDDGTAATDSLPIEQRRGISVRTSTAYAMWNGAVINLIDTPGHVDFAGEVERSLAALDYAVVVVSAPDGVRAHTENILRALENMNIPRLVFVNKADRAGSDTESVLAELQETTGKPLLFLSDVKNEGRDSVSVSALSDAAFAARATEVLAELDDEAADAFLSDEVMPHERAADLVRRAVRECRLIPVLAGAAKLCLGVRELLCPRYPLLRSFREAETPWGPVTVKRAEGWGVSREKPEFEDLAKIAREQNLSLRDVKEKIKTVLWHGDI